MFSHTFADEGLQRSAGRAPDTVALVCDRQRLTYGALDTAADAFASGLQRAGIRRGDRVVIRLENCVEAVVAIFGSLRAGATFVPVGPTVKEEKLAFILADSRPAVLVFDHRAGALVSAAMRTGATPPLCIAVGEESEHAPNGSVAFDEFIAATDGAPRLDRIDLDLAALIYTSGSTGRPKAVTLTHANMVSAAASIDAYLGNTPDDVILDVLPLSFDYGLYQLFLAFGARATLVLERSFVYPTTVLDIIEREQVTALPVVPTLAALLIKFDLRRCGSLRYITNTGAALPPTHIAELRRQLPQVRIFSMYGLTECKRVSFLPPEELDARPTSVGRAMDNVEVYILTEDGTLAASGEGELVVRGSNVMVGYWNDSEATERVLLPGFFPGQRLLRTGDRFRIDEDGYMYFLGRLDDQIKSRGQRVSPKEVEHAIYALPGVTGVAVFGVPDPVLGMAVTALVTVAPSAALSPLDIMRHCADRLEDYMVPRDIDIVDALPTTESGKIDRRRLQGDARAH